MTDTKRLAFSIIQFLHNQLDSGGLSSDAQESLEVAIQCLETAFDVSIEDKSLAVAQTLPEIFATASVTTPQINVNSVPFTPNEEEVAEAERLKTEGNDKMKEENFSEAVEFYSKAIEINPQNAVYYCNRAAAYSKLGNYAGAVQDCELAIGIDPNYSKAYGRMGLALASLNKHTEAVNFYQKALELDPENDTYKSNLKIAEQKMREAPSPTVGMGGADLAGLLSNPGFMNMKCWCANSSTGTDIRKRKRVGAITATFHLFQASTLMSNPQVQQMMSGMMSGAYGSTAATVAPGPGGVGPGDLSGLIHAGQQFAQQMQEQNPELIEQLRNQVRSRPPSSSNEEQH